jgi:hypothetical protein
MDDLDRILQNNWNNTFSSLHQEAMYSRDSPNNPIDNISMSARYNTAVDTQFREVRDKGIEKRTKRKKVIDNNDDDDENNESGEGNSDNNNNKRKSSSGRKRRNEFDDEAEEDNECASEDQQQNNDGIQPFGGGNNGNGGSGGGGNPSNVGRGRGGRGLNNNGEGGEGRGRGNKKPKVVRWGYVPVRELLHPYQRKIQDDGGFDGEDCYSSCDDEMDEEEMCDDECQQELSDEESEMEIQQEKIPFTQENVKRMMFPSDSESNSDITSNHSRHNSPKQSMACGSESDNNGRSVEGGCTVDGALSVPGSNRIYKTPKGNSQFFNSKLNGYGSDCSTTSSLGSRGRRGKRKQNNNRRGCFGCMYGNRGIDSIKMNNMNYLITLIEEHIGRMHYYDLAKMAHLYFKHSIYLPMKREGLKIQNWRTYDIYLHLKYHIMEPKFFIWNTIADLSDRLTVLNDMWFKKTWMEDGNEIIVPDEKVIRMSMDTQRRIIETYKLNPKVMNFYNEHSNISFENIGKLINTNKDWKFDK